MAGVPVRVLIADNEQLAAAGTTAALDLSDRELREIGEAGRERALSEHTSDRRAATLEAEIEAARSRAGPAQALPMEA